MTDLAAGYGDRALALQLDVADPVSVTEAVQDCERIFGRIDVLANNAGYGYLAAIEEGEDAGVRALYDTNVHGVVRVLKAALPGMRARRSGRVVNISSFGGASGLSRDRLLPRHEVRVGGPVRVTGSGTRATGNRGDDR